MKILIAEDEPWIIEQYKAYLESKGHEVLLTKDGERCLQFYTASLPTSPKPARAITPPFDIVILDVRMPKIGGVEVAQEMLAMCPKQKIIIATAYGNEATKGLVEHLGENVEVLIKPFDLDELVALLDKPGQKSMPFL